VQHPDVFRCWGGPRSGALSVLLNARERPKQSIKWIDCKCANIGKGSVCDAIRQHASGIWKKQSADTSRTSVLVLWANNGGTSGRASQMQGPRDDRKFLATNPIPLHPAAWSPPTKARPFDASRLPRHCVRVPPAVVRSSSPILPGDVQIPCAPTTSRRFLRTSASRMHCGARAGNGLLG